MNYHQRLVFDLWGAGLAGETRHAQLVMNELGITYQVAVPQSISDSWEFFNCENVPDELPSYLSSAPVNPFDKIGYGLSKEMAEQIAAYKHEQHTGTE